MRDIWYKSWLQLKRSEISDEFDTSELTGKAEGISVLLGARIISYAEVFFICYVITNITHMCECTE